MSSDQSLLPASPAAANGPEAAEHGQRRHADRAGPCVSHQSGKGIGDAPMRVRQTGWDRQAAIGMMLRPGPPGTPRGRSIRTIRIRIGVGRESRPSGIRAATPLPLPFTDPLIGVGRGEPAERTEERAGNFEGHRGTGVRSAPVLGNRDDKCTRSQPRIHLSRRLFFASATLPQLGLAPAVSILRVERCPILPQPRAHHARTVRPQTVQVPR